MPAQDGEALSRHSPLMQTLSPMNCLELIKDREIEIESGITAPCHGRITVSTDFVRQLIAEHRALGKEVYRDLDTNIYIFDGIEIEPSGELPKGSFLIQLIPE